MSHNIFRNRRDLGQLLNPIQLLATDYRRYVPSINKINMQSVQPGTISQVTLTFQIDTGKHLTIDFGNDYIVTLTGNNSNMNAVSNYTIPNTTYNITITGDFGNVINFIVINSTLKINQLSEIAKFINLKQLSLSNVNLLTGSIIELPRSLNNLYLFGMPNFYMTGAIIDLPRDITYLYLHNGQNLNITGSLSDLPSGLGTVVMYNLLNMYVTGTVFDWPRNITFLYLHTLPNLNITGSLSDLPSGSVNLTFYNLASFIVDPTATTNCTNLTSLQYYALPNGIVSLDIATSTKLSGNLYLYDNHLLQSITLPTFTVQLASINVSICALDQLTVNSIFAKLNIWYSAHPPTANLIVNTRGGTNAVPTGGASNTDILNLISIFSTAGKSFTYLIN